VETKVRTSSIGRVWLPVFHEVFRVPENAPDVRVHGVLVLDSLTVTTPEDPNCHELVLTDSHDYDQYINDGLEEKERPKTILYPPGFWQTVKERKLRHEERWYDTKMEM
jgi:hypothetical protein